MSAKTSVFPNYTLLEKIGEGAVSEVYRAVRTGGYQTEQFLAFKRVPYPIARDPLFSRSFLQGADRARRISHPNLAQICDRGEHEGTLYLVTEFRPGYSLDRILAYRRRLRQPLAAGPIVFLMQQLCEALKPAHQMMADDAIAWPLVHGDIKPSNVLVGYDGSATLLDLGTGTGAMLEPEGPLVWLSRDSVGYLAPEQIQGTRDDVRSDVYALGAIMFELLTLEPLLEVGPVLEMLRRVAELDISERLKLLKEYGIENDLARVVHGALQRKTKARFPDAAAFSQALSELRLPGFQTAPATWINLLAALRVDEESSWVTQEKGQLPAVTQIDSLEPWDLCWMEGAACSAEAWLVSFPGRLEVKAGGEEAFSSSEPRGVVLLDDDELDDDGWDTDWTAEPTITFTDSISISIPEEQEEPDHYDAAALASDDLSDRDEIQPSAPLELRFEDLEATGEIPEEYREQLEDDEADEDDSQSIDGLGVGQVLPEPIFAGLETALVQLGNQEGADQHEDEAPDAPEVIAVEDPAFLMEGEEDPTMEVDYVSQAEVGVAEEDTGAVDLTGDEVESTRDDFMTTKMPDNLATFAPFVYDASVVDGEEIEVGSEEDEPDEDIADVVAAIVAPEPAEIVALDEGGDASDVVAVEVTEPSESVALENGEEVGEASAVDGPEPSEAATFETGEGASELTAADVPEPGEIFAPDDGEDGEAFGADVPEPGEIFAPENGEDATAGATAGPPGEADRALPDNRGDADTFDSGEEQEITEVAALEDEEDVTDVPDAVTLAEITGELDVVASPYEGEDDQNLFARAISVEDLSSEESLMEITVEVAYDYVPGETVEPLTAATDKPEEEIHAVDGEADEKPLVVSTFEGEDETSAAASNEVEETSFDEVEEEITDELPVVALGNMEVQIPSAEPDEAVLDAPVAEQEDMTASNAPEIVDEQVDISPEVVDEQVATEEEVVGEQVDTEAEVVDEQVDTEAEVVDGQVDTSPEIVDEQVDISPEIVDEQVDTEAEVVDGQVDISPEIVDEQVDTEAEVVDAQVDISPVEEGFSSEALDTAPDLAPESGEVDSVELDTDQSGSVDYSDAMDQSDSLEQSIPSEDTAETSLPDASAAEFVQLDESNDGLDLEITGEYAAEVLDLGFEEDTLSAEIDAVLGHTTETSFPGDFLAEEGEGPLEIEALSVSDMPVPEVPSSSKVNLKHQQIADGRVEEIPELLQKPSLGIKLPSIGLEEIEAIGAEEALETDEPGEGAAAGRQPASARTPSGAAPVSPAQSAPSARPRASHSGVQADLFIPSEQFLGLETPGTRGEEGIFDSARLSRSRRLVLPEGFVLQNRYRVDRLLMELPRKSLYQVTVQEDGRNRKCYSCGYANNLVEDAFCYRCKSPLLPRTLTLSMLLDRKQSKRNQLFSEMRLKHPGIATIFDEFVGDGILFRVLDTLGGLSSGTLLSQARAPLRERKLADITIRCAQALYFLHGSGISCLMLSDSNIFLRDDQVQLYDFDVAEVYSKEIVPTPLRIKDVISLGRVLTRFLPEKSSALGEVLLEATDGRFSGADRLAQAVGAAVANSRQHEAL